MNTIKVRDLQPSYNFRQLRNKQAGIPCTRRRVILATARDQTTRQNNVSTNTGEDEEGIVKNEKENVDRILHNTDEEIACKRIEHKEFKNWVVERKSLRNDLNLLGLNASWVANKPCKTESEIRVMKRIRKNIDKIKIEANQNELEDKARNRKLSSGHVDLLPYVESPLPIALAVIADYLSEHRLRLVDLFSRGDKNKDWHMTRGELKKAFQRIDTPLTDIQLDDLIFTLDINNDNQLSYKEVAQGIEAYHKDRRWQKMKEMYDSMVAKNDDESMVDSTGKRSPETEHKTKLVLLNLPKPDFSEDNSPGIYLQKMARDRRMNKRKEKREALKRSLKASIPTTTTEGIPAPFDTTLTGSTRNSKVDYLRFVNEESERCIDMLHENGIFVPSSSIRRVLIPPSENPSEKCAAFLSSSLSAYPYNHSLNIKYRKTQRKLLRKYENTVNNNGNGGMKTPNVHAQETASSIKHRKFLPRVATVDFNGMAKEGRRRRRQLECASPSPYWPQHLLDKLCLCMDDCDLGSDGKNVLFNKVTGK